MTREEQIKQVAKEYADDGPDRVQNIIAKVGFEMGAKWADKNPDFSMVSALAYKAGRESAINDAVDWLKGNLHLAIDCDDEGCYHIDPNFVDYFKVRMEKGGKQ